jgi:hypothetical protein
MTRISTVEMATAASDRLRRGRRGRRAFAVSLVAVLVAGLGMVFGERVDRVGDTEGDYELVVAYPSRTRGGLTQDIDIVLRREGGFDGPVTLGLSIDYLRAFEPQDIQPQPSSSTGTRERVEWTFDPPTGDTLRGVVDVRVEPHRFHGAAGRLVVLDEGVEHAAVRLETAVMP